MVNDKLHIIMPVKDSLEIAEKAIRAIVDSGHTLYVYDDNSLPENAPIAPTSRAPPRRLLWLLPLTATPPPRQSRPSIQRRQRRAHEAWVS